MELRLDGEGQRDRLNLFDREVDLEERLQNVSKTAVDSGGLRSTRENSIRLSNCFGITRLDQKSRAISKLKKRVIAGSSPVDSANYVQFKHLHSSGKRNDLRRVRRRP